MYRPWTRITAGRRAILGALARLHPHPSTSEILKEARAAVPNLSRATLFRALRQLTIAGLLRPVLGPGGRTVYIHLQDGRHHHFLCLRCGRVQELATCPLCDAAVTIGEARVHGHFTELYGTCDACSSSRSD